MNVKLSIRDLFVDFATPLGVAKVLNGVNLDVYQGEVFGVVGETGCGKSVTSMSILRVLPQNAYVRGSIVFEGEELLEKTEEEMREIRGSKISMVFQDPMTSLNPLFKIGEQMIDVVRAHRSVGKREALDMISSLLADVRLSDPSRIVSSYPHELSGGMKQRVMIAMALSLKPSLIIADEPTTALDVTVQRQVLDLILELQEKYGFSVLLITHDLGVVAETCDRVGIMYAGDVVEIAPIEKLFSNPLHPYTRALLSVIPDISGKKRLTPLGGSVPSLLHPPTGCRFHPRCRFLKDVCRQDKPILLEVEDEHFVSCHLYGGR